MTDQLQAYIQKFRTSLIIIQQHTALIPTRSVLIVPFFKCANKTGATKMSDGIELIKHYYESRCKQGQIV